MIKQKQLQALINAFEAEDELCVANRRRKAELRQDNLLRNSLTMLGAVLSVLATIFVVGYILTKKPVQKSYYSQFARADLTQLVKAFH